MVYLKKIVINGFKSFGPKRNVINFEKGYVVITGPNGGGKSNVVDAIKFALGELSAQSMRASKLSDLIYDGGDGRKASSARVTLVLDNSDRGLPIDEDEITITRKLMPNGESVYQLNGKNVSRSDLLAFLATSNIKPSGINIVTQGSVLGIAEMSPDEVRKLLEEVAGTSEYDRRKAEALAELDKAERNIAVARAGTLEIKQMVRQLEKERTHVVRRSIIEDDLNYLRREGMMGELAEIEKTIEKLVEEESSLLAKKEDLERNLLHLKEEKSALLEELKEKQSLIGSIEEEISSTEEELYHLEREMSELKNRIRQLGSRYVAAVKEMISGSNSLGELARRESELLRELDKILAEKEVIESEISEVSRKVESLTRRRSELLSSLRSLEEEEGKLTREANERMRKVAELDGKCQRLESSIGIIEEEVRRLEQRLGEIETQEAELTTKMRELEERRSSLAQKMEGLRETCRSYKTKISELLPLLDEIEKEVIQSIRLISSAERRIEPEEDKREELLRSIVSKLPSNETIGILRELVSPPHGNEALFYNLLGERIDAIVVRRKSFAEALVRFAAEMGLKLFVIAIDGWKGCRQKSCIACLSGASSRDALAALHYALEASTLVTDEVSLCRDLMVHQKGYARLNHGLYRSYGRLTDVQSLYSSLESLKLLNNGLESYREEIRKELKRLEELLRNGRDELVKLHAEMNEVEAQIRSITQLRDSLASEKKKLSSRIDEKRLELSSLRDELERSKALTAEARSQLLDFSGVRAERKAVTAELSRCEEELRERSSKLSSLNERLSSLLRSKVRYETELQRIRKTIEEIQSNTKSRELDAIKSTIRRQSVEYSERYLRYSELRSSLEGLKGRLNELKGETSTLRSKIEEIDLSINSEMGKLHELEREATSLRVALMELNMRRNSLNEKISDLKPFKTNVFSLLTSEEKAAIINMLDEELRTLQLVNQLAPTQYEQFSENYKVRAVRIAELEQERSNILRLIEKIDSEKLEAFMRTFEKVSREFCYYFNKLTGGEAWLELVDPERPLESGIELVVKFVGKPPRSSKSISGGEKSVSAVALLMALQGLTPADFYIFDEVDAHMDLSYTRNLADLFKEMSKKTQIIAVSLKDIMGEHADQLVGVYSQDGESRLIVTKIGEVVGKDTS